MQLHNVTADDVDAYIRMRCDPVMMADLGGPLPRELQPDKARRDAIEAAADICWIKMIIPDPDTPAVVAGSVTIWSHDADEGPVSEIGWMVLPQFQGRGLGKLAARTLLEQARDEDRWGVVHAFPATGNNHWAIDPSTGLTTVTTADGVNPGLTAACCQPTVDT